MFISLGSSCSIAENLKILNLRNKALPFDWIRVQNFKNINLMIETDFEYLWDINNFLFQKDSNNFFLIDDKLNFIKESVEIYQNKNYNANFYHDFPKKYLFKDSFIIFKEKYQRRVNRFYDIIKKENSIIFIREQIKPNLIKVEDLDKFYNLIKNINSTLEFKLILIVNNFINKNLDELISYSNKNSWIKLKIENSKLNSWQRYDVIKPIILSYSSSSESVLTLSSSCSKSGLIE